MSDIIGCVPTITETEYAVLLGDILLDLVPDRSRIVAVKKARRMVIGIHRSLPDVYDLDAELARKVDVLIYVWLPRLAVPFRAFREEI
jgi:hypothetical protein